MIGGLWPGRRMIRRVIIAGMLAGVTVVVLGCAGAGAAGSRPLGVTAVSCTRAALKPIAVGNQPGPIVIAPDGKTAYVANAGSGTVTPIRTATNLTGPPPAKSLPDRQGVQGQLRTRDTQLRTRDTLNLLKPPSPLQLLCTMITNAVTRAGEKARAFRRDLVPSSGLGGPLSSHRWS